jgi:hypothetical protein
MAILSAAAVGRVSYKTAQGVIRKHDDEISARESAQQHLDAKVSGYSGFPDRRIRAFHNSVLQDLQAVENRVHDPKIDWARIIPGFGADNFRKFVDKLNSVLDQYDKRDKTPITAETERKYTAMIKQRQLYEGAC